MDLRSLKDLASEMFGKGKEEINGVEWDWAEFESTENYPVSENLLDWVIGQDSVIEKVRLALRQWLHKLKWLEEEGFFKKRFKESPDQEITESVKKLPPGPFILMLGPPGTGKSLIGRAMAEELTRTYREEGIKLVDVLSWRNEKLPSNPVITVHRAGDGVKLARREQIKAAAEERWTKWLVLGVCLSVALMGAFIMLLGLWPILNLLWKWYSNPLIRVDSLQLPFRAFYGYSFKTFLSVLTTRFSVAIAYYLAPATTMLILPIFILVLGRGWLARLTGLGGTLKTVAPKVIVDNSSGSAPFIDCTGHTSPQLFGCLDLDTFVVTSTGPRTIAEVREGDWVWVLDRFTQRPALERVSAIHIYEYSGPMFHWANERVDILVTPEHRMLVKFGPSREPVFIRAWELARTSSPFYLVGLRDQEVAPEELEVVEYSGIVWCLSTPSSNFLVVRNGAMLFTGNSITWDPYQSGGLQTPEHQRVNAGDVHRAHLGILYIDEIKNLQSAEVVTLLTVLEDGELPITHRAERIVSGTAALAVATDPVPCLIFLVAAGNYDSLSMMHPALLDRIRGYGSIISVNEDMEDSVENRRKYVQFIAQELKRFRYQAFDRSACEELVKEARRLSGYRDRLTCKFRPLVNIILKASQIAKDKGRSLTTGEDVKEAIEEHAKSIHQQLMESLVEKRAKYLEIEPRGVKMGEIYGLAVVQEKRSGARAGVVGKLTAYMHKKHRVPGEDIEGYYKVTGTAKDGKWIQDSIDKVRTVILKRYGVDIAQQFFTHLDFAQSQGAEGPSAGVALAVLLCSLLEGKPIRQDTALTGEINIATADEILVTAVGGIHEKIRAAEMFGFKRVLIPQRNLEVSINPEDYEIEIVGCRTLDDYLEEMLVQSNVNNSLLDGDPGHGGEA